MLKVLQASDFHLDAPFSSLPADKAAQRRAELRTLPSRIAQLARAAAVDLVLLPGDLFDSNEVYTETKEALVVALAETGCPVFIAPGNHDYYGLHTPYAKLNWPDNVHIFTQSTLEAVHIPEKKVTLWGSAFQAPNRSGSPLAGFVAPKDGNCHIALLHGDTMGGTTYGPLTESEIAQSGLSYLALGHVHGYSGLRRAGRTHWAYSGCPEGRGFDELGDKGCMLVAIDDDGTVREQFISLAQRKYRIIEVQMTGENPQAELISALPEDGKADIVRLILKGACPPEGLPLYALEQLASPYFYSVTLYDQTRVRRDLWTRAEEDNLTGLFLQQIQTAMATASPEEQRSLELAVRFGLAALESREEPT